ncbi:hypothetical protein Amn_pa04470 (plasmid) [Aminobacter sp. Y103A]|nr:hypothetical protein Amn_pa04470 [Aminobacter sp. SS-2016]
MAPDADKKRLKGRFLLSWHSRLKDCQVFKQRNNTDNDHNYLRNLPHLGVDRQALNQIKHKYDHQERDQDTDEHG